MDEIEKQLKLDAEKLSNAKNEREQSKILKEINNQSQKKYKSIALKINPRALEQIRELQKELKLDSIHAVIEKSLTDTNYFVRVVKQGGKIIIRDKDGNERELLLNKKGEQND